MPATGRPATPPIMAAFRILTLAAFAALIAFGCLLRFWKIGQVGLWYDELWTVVGASDRPFMEMYREWIVGDAHPPGYFLLYFAWFTIVPNTEFWARVPNGIAGVVTVLYLLVGTRRILSRDERIMAASFASLSYIYIFYALSVKQYSAVILGTTVATITYLEIITANRVSRRTAITLTITGLALAYLNHLAMVFGWLLIALLALTFRHNRDDLRQVRRIAIAFALGYLPITYFLYLQLKYSIDAWQPYLIRAFVAELLPSLFFDDPSYVKAALVVLFGFLLLAIERQDTRHALATPRNRHLIVIVAAATTLMLALGLSEPIFFVRYFLVIFPALLLALAILTAAVFPIGQGWLAVLPLVFFLHAARVQFHAVDGLQRQQWDKSVDFVLASKKPDERVFVLGAKMDKTEFDYLKEGDIDDVFYVRNLKFYEYYFRRRGADDIAATLESVQPSVESARELTTRYRGSGTTIYVLAGHHIQYTGEALATLQHAVRHLDITPMNSTLVYRLTF